MSRLYAYVRFLPKFMFFDKNLCVLAVVNSQIAANRNFQSFNSVDTLHYKCVERDPFVATIRSFSKGKGKLKKGAPKIAINEHELSQVFDVEKLYLEFKSPVDYLIKVYVEQLNLRTSANSVQNIKVRHDGGVYTIQDLAEIKRKSSKEIILDMGCFTGAIPDVLESLRNSPLNVNPTQEGSSIIIPTPKVTQEFRESLAKKAKVFFNKCKDGIRHVQNKNIKVLNDRERLSEDVVFRLKAQITAIAEKHMTQAEELFNAKEKELLSTE